MSRVQRLLIAFAAASFALNAAAQATGVKPPAGKTKPAAKAQPKQPVEVDSPGVEAVTKIFECVAEGLPKDWRRAWVVVTEISGGQKERAFEGKFEYSLDPDGKAPLPLKPCNPQEVAQRVHALNDFLEYEKRQWKVATLTFMSDGKFEIKYDYVR